MRRVASAVGLLSLLLGVGSTRAQDSVRIPAVDRPVENFYNAAGPAVKVRFEAKPTELTTEEWLTLTLTVSGVQNPRDVTRPDLGKRAIFQKRFQITDLPDPEPAGTDRRVFAWRLRPVGTDVRQVPPLPFSYFNPQVPESLRGARFPLTAADSVALVVRPPVAPQPRLVLPLEVPAFAEQIVPSDQAESRLPRWAGGSLFISTLDLVLVLAPLVGLAWIVLWHRRYPDAARQVQLRRSRAARRALAELARVKRRDTPDPGSAIADALLRYLHERAGVAIWARTPADVAAELGRAGFAADTAGAARAVFAACDEARFAPATAVDRERLASHAERLVNTFEETA